MVNRKDCLGMAVASLAALTLMASAVQAQDQSEDAAFSSAEEQAIRELVRDYLMENPEVLVESLQIYQERQRVAAQERQQQRVSELQQALTEDADDPVIGNPDGDVVVVEFFDYRCPYCQRVASDINTIVKEDGNIRLVMKELPILGPASRYAAKAALAAAKQDKYEELHFALMEVEGQLDNLAVLRVAQSVGLDIEQLQQDMRDPEIDQLLRRTYELAQSLEINGTPAFVVGNRLIPGALDPQALRQLVAQQREQSS